MAKKGNFGIGLILGAAAGFAAKYLVDNKEEVKAVATEKAKVVKDSVSEFVGYAGDKLNNIGSEVTKTASEYVDYAKEQFNEIKDTLTAELTATKSDYKPQAVSESTQPTDTTDEE